MAQLAELIKQHKFKIYLCIWGFVELSLLALMMTFLFLVDSDCRYAKTCTYMVQNHTNIDCEIFSYQLIINGRTGCEMWCNDPFNVTTCPEDGGTCQITEPVRDYCKYHGFADLFDCYNYFYYELGLAFFALLCMGMPIGSIGALYYHSPTTTLNERMPLYSNPS